MFCKQRLVLYSIFLSSIMILQGSIVYKDTFKADTNFCDIRLSTLHGLISTKMLTPPNSMYANSNGNFHHHFFKNGCEHPNGFFSHWPHHYPYLLLSLGCLCQKLLLGKVALGIGWINDLLDDKGNIIPCTYVLLSSSCSIILVLS